MQFSTCCAPVSGNRGTDYLSQAPLALTRETGGLWAWVRVAGYRLGVPVGAVYHDCVAALVAQRPNARATARSSIAAD